MPIRKTRRGSRWSATRSPNAIGRTRIRVGRRFAVRGLERTIVGVVGHVRVRGLERESEPQMYLPSRQVEDSQLIPYLPRTSSSGARGRWRTPPIMPPPVAPPPITPPPVC